MNLLIGWKKLKHKDNYPKDNYPLDSLNFSDKEIFMVKNILEERPYSGKRKILFMDDQPYIRRMVANMLTYLGYEVEFARNGAEAIEMYKEAKESGQPFDVVILDLTVRPGMGCECAIEKLVEIDTDVKAIITSGYSDEAIISDYRRYGFCGAVSKPYTINELNETLSRVIMGDREEALHYI